MAWKTVAWYGRGASATRLGDATLRLSDAFSFARAFFRAPDCDEQSGCHAVFARLELGVGHVACRYVTTVARIWKARVLMERGFVSRRVARFEAAQASLWARSGCPVTCV